MADFTVSFDPATRTTAEGSSIRLTPIVDPAPAAASPDTYKWTGPHNASSEDASLVLESVTTKSAGTYEVTVTRGSVAKPAKVELEITPAEPIPIWDPKLALVASIGLGAATLFLALPAFVLAFRSTFQSGSTGATAAVAGMLVSAGLLALGVAAFLLVMDYRGHARVKAAVASHVAGLLPDPAKSVDAVAKLLQSVGKTIQGAVALLVAAVAIFLGAAWAVHNSTSGTPSPSPSSSASSPSSAPVTSSPGPSGSS